MGTAEYWRLNESLSAPVDLDAPLQPLSRVRFFEVADDALFVKTHGQIEATLKAMGYSRARSFYRKQFRHRDGRDWALVESYDNWAELEGNDSLRERPRKTVTSCGASAFLNVPGRNELRIAARFLARLGGGPGVRTADQTCAPRLEPAAYCVRPLVPHALLQLLEPVHDDKEPLSLGPPIRLSLPARRG